MGDGKDEGRSTAVVGAPGSPPTLPAPSPAGGLGTFLIIWVGEFVSLVGTSMSRFAIMIWGWQQTGHATTLTLLMFFNVGTAVVLSPLAGVVVDRVDRRKVMIFADCTNALVTVALLSLYLTGHLRLGYVYAAAVANGAFETFQFPAYSAAVTMMVDRRHYARTSGLISLAESASRIVGPPLAGVLLPLVGIPTIFVIDLVTFGVAIVSLSAVRVPPPPPSEEGRQRVGIWQQAVFGLRYIGRRRGLLGLQLLLAAGNLLLIFGVTLRAPLVLSRTGGDQALLGVVMAAAGTGGVLGGLLMAAWGGPRRRIRGVVGGLALGAIGHAVLGSARQAATWMAGAFAYPLAMTLTNASNQAIWQTKVAPDVQGRVFAARRLIAQFTLLPGLLLAGPLSDRLFEPAMAAGAPGCRPAGAPRRQRPRRRHRPVDRGHRRAGARRGRRRLGGAAGARGGRRPARPRRMTGEIRPSPPWAGRFAGRNLRTR